MSAFPALEEALDEAAHRHYGRKRRRLRWRFAVPALATIAAAASVAVIALPEPASPPPAKPQPAARVTVATLDRSHAYARRPDTARYDPAHQPRVAHADLPSLAERLRRPIPYPPGMVDDFDWAATPSDPRDMSSINNALEVQNLVEFRAGCLWLLYWLGTTDPRERRAAASVLADVPQFPRLRVTGPRMWRRIAKLAAAGDALELRAIQPGQCHGM
jgi:hypothetical protein